MCEYNAKLLASVGPALTVWGAPFVIGGDCNMPPGALLEAGLDVALGAKCVTAPGHEPTHIAKAS